MAFRSLQPRPTTELSRPGLLIGVGARLSSRFARRGQAGLVNMVVTNVPGPRQPLYFAGARCLRTFGAGPVVDGMGLINTIYSYGPTIAISFTSDRDAMPDPAAYADALRASFKALKAAATERATPPPVEDNDNKPSVKAGSRRKSNG